MERITRAEQKSAPEIPISDLTESSEREALGALNFEKERRELKKYWNRRLDESARLITPEPMLNEFYRALPGHLLINCEREPTAPEGLRGWGRSVTEPTEMSRA